MSLQSNTSNKKSQFSKVIYRALQGIAALSLLTAFSVSHAQSVSTRTAFSLNRDGSTVKLSVTVKDAIGTPVSDGTVNFVSNGKSLGSAFVDAEGDATLSLDKLPANATQVTAVYSGTDHYAASSSANVSVTPDATTAPPDFTVSANPASLTLTAGQFGTAVITVAPENGFSQSVTLTTSGLPDAARGYFTPASVIPVNGAGANSTLQFQTTASSKTSSAMLGSSTHLTYALIFPGIFALVGIGAMRRRNVHLFRTLGLAALMLAGVSGLTACSQRYNYLHHPPASNPGTPAGSYPITITAYSNSGGEVTSHSIQFTLTVK